MQNPFSPSQVGCFDYELYRKNDDDDYKLVENTKVLPSGVSETNLEIQLEDSANNFMSFVKKTADKY